MEELIVFYSGNPDWVTCKTAIGVAKEMQEKYGDKLNVKIRTTDSEEAKGYTFNTATNVLFSNQWVPLNVAMDTEKMQDFLSKKL